MSSVVGWILGGIGVASALTIVVLWIRSAIDNKTALDERDAALKLEAERNAVMEAARLADEEKSRQELDAKASSVRNVDDAVALVREELSRASGTPTADEMQGNQERAGTKP